MWLLEANGHRFQLIGPAVQKRSLMQLSVAEGFESNRRGNAAVVLLSGSCTAKEGHRRLL